MGLGGSAWNPERGRVESCLMHKSIIPYIQNPTHGRTGFSAEITERLNPMSDGT